jgi:hypothetical protein
MMSGGVVVGSKATALQAWRPPTDLRSFRHHHSNENEGGHHADQQFTNPDLAKTWNDTAGSGVNSTGVAALLGDAEKNAEGRWRVSCPICLTPRAAGFFDRDGGVETVATGDCACEPREVRLALHRRIASVCPTHKVEKRERKITLEVPSRDLPKRPNGALPAHAEIVRPDRRAVDAEIARLASLDAVTYERERKGAATELVLSVGFVDRAVKAVREERSAGSDGPPEIEPWPHGVDGAELLDEIAATIRRHVGVPTRAEEAIALWIVHAHCFEVSPITPRLAIKSPTPECGKTTLLNIVESMVPRALNASNITAAAVFRAVEKWRPTLIVDEADTFLPNNEELRGILNSGHARNGGVVRTVGDDHEPRRFSTWCPVAVALIGKLPATLASRSIHIELQRLMKGERVEPYRSHKAPYADLARRIARWAADNSDALRDAEPDMEGITNRRADNWRPLFAIADQVGGDWWSVRAREAAHTLDHADAGQGIAEQLLEDLRALIGTEDRITSKALAVGLAEMEGRPWPEFGKSSKPITQNAIARLLKRFEIEPRNLRDSDTGQTVKGYWAFELVDAFDRYLQDPPSSNRSTATSPAP